MKGMMKWFDGVLSNKRKFRRLLAILIILAAVICYGFHSDAINISVGKIFNSEVGK